MTNEMISLPKVEYEDMKDFMERMKETIDVLSSKDTVKKLEDALNRFENKEFLSEKEIVS
tara:strand:+ start:214 stop:393 length:180 start_codon:yes stop_codon:yes gene_type:complete